MENVVNSLNDVSDDFLQVLNLNISVEHQKWVWNGHIDPLNSPFVLAPRIRVLLGWACAVVVLMWILSNLGLLKLVGVHYHLMRHACVWVNCPLTRNDSGYLLLVVTWLWLAGIMVRYVSWVDYSALGLGGCDCLRVYFLSVFVDISLGVDSLWYLLLYHLLLLLNIHLGKLLLLAVLLYNLLLKLLPLLNFLPLTIWLVLGNCDHLLVLLILSLSPLGHDSLHDESSFSLVCGSGQNLLLLLPWMGLNNDLRILVLHLLLLSVICLGIKSILQLLLVVILRVLVQVGLKLWVGSLSANIIVKSDVLAGLYFINSIVIQMGHHILLLSSDVVVIIGNIPYDHFGFLHHIHRSRNLLLDEVLSLLLIDGYLSILILLYHDSAFLKLILLFVFFVIDLFSSKQLSLHLNIVHLLLLV